MPEAIPAVAEFFAADGAVAAGADAAVASAGALATAGGGDVALGAAAAASAAGAGVAAAGGLGAAAASGGLGSIGNSLATAVGTQLAGSMFSKTKAAPTLPTPVTMPDPLAQEAATKKSLVEQLARRGRASTILTDPAGSGKLGG